MNAITRSDPKSITFTDAIRESVSTRMSDLIADESSMLSGLDRWTRSGIVADIMAKTDLVLEAVDPVEHCYQNLIREIDFEAEMGVLLANKSVGPDALRCLCEEPGVSGELHREIERFAPVMFADEYRHSDGDLDLVWASVQAGYDRSRLDAEVSELIMQFFVDSAETAHDMTNAMRSMFYSFHEEGVRRQFDMSSLLEEREMHDLFVMLSELVDRAGSYEDRISAIVQRAARGNASPLLM